MSLGPLVLFALAGLTGNLSGLLLSGYYIGQAYPRAGFCLLVASAVFLAALFGLYDEAGEPNEGPPENPAKHGG